MKKTVNTIQQMIMLNIINIGFVIFWAVDGAFMTNYLTKKGYSPFEVSDAVAGSILTIGQVMVCVGFLIGLLSDGTRTKLGKRIPFMISGIIAAAIGYVFIPHMKSLQMVILVQSIVYFFIVWSSIPYFSIIPDTTPDEKLGTCNAFFNVFGALGTIIGYLVVGGMLADKVKFPDMYRFLPFYATSGVMLLFMIMTVLSAREDTDYSKQPKPEPLLKRAGAIFTELPKYRNLSLFMALNFFMWMGIQGFVKYFTRFMDADVHVEFSKASLLMGAIPIVAIFFAVPLGILADKISRKKMLMTGLVAASAIMLIGFFLIKDLISAGVIITFAAVAVIDVFLLMGTIAPTLMPRDKVGYYIGVLSATTGLGGAAGVMISGYLSTALLDGMHCRVIFLIGAICLACSAIVLIPLKIQNAWELAKEAEQTAGK